MGDTQDRTWNAMSVIEWLKSCRKWTDMPGTTISCCSLIPPFPTGWCGTSGLHGALGWGSYTGYTSCLACSGPPRCDWLWWWYSSHIYNTKGKMTLAFYHPSLVYTLELGDCGSSGSPYCCLTASPHKGETGWRRALLPRPYATVSEDLNLLVHLILLRRCSWYQLVSGSAQEWLYNPFSGLWVHQVQSCVPRGAPCSIFDPGWIQVPLV